jgi:hypothetical protein
VLYPLSYEGLDAENLDGKPTHFSHSGCRRPHARSGPPGWVRPVGSARCLPYDGPMVAASDACPAVASDLDALGAAPLDAPPAPAGPG